MVEKVRNLSKELGKPVGILLDCNGPKLRTEMLFDGKAVHLNKGDSFTFYENEPSIQGPGNYVQAKGLCGNVLAGDKIYVDDGLLAFTVIRSNLESIECSIDNSGVLGNRKGINLATAPPMTKPFLKRRDREDLELAKKLNVEFVTVSCVRNASDLEEIKTILYNSPRTPMTGKHSPRLLSKIENKSGLESFEAILAQSDGIIIDRGYLGVEIDLASISTIQKLLVQGCTMKGKSVLIANHILESMRELPRPSRSEASDIASAVFLGGDGYILSSETAIGAYPVESLQWLRRICTESETHLDHLEFQLRLLKANPKPVPISESIASSAVKCAREVDASCIIVSTEGGGMARLISKYRPSIPIVAGCGDDRIAAQLAASFGVIPVVVKCKNSADDGVEGHKCEIDPSLVVYESLKYATALGLIEDGNRVVVASGQVDGFLDGSSTFMQKASMSIYTSVGPTPPGNDKESFRPLCKFPWPFVNSINKATVKRASTANSNTLVIIKPSFDFKLASPLETERNIPYSDTRKSKRKPNPSASSSSQISSHSTSASNLRHVKSVELHVTKEKTQPKSKNRSKGQNNRKGGNKSNEPAKQQFPHPRPLPKSQSFQQLPKSTPAITTNNYVDMVMADLSTRPALWHFSSYGLTLNQTQSLPFPFLGTTELSPEELRLQIYAEAAATGGRIDNYVKVIGDIKDRAESTTKALIPNLEKVISDLLRANNVDMNVHNNNSTSTDLQETLKQTLKQRLSALQSTPTIAINQQYQQQQYHEPLIQLPHQLQVATQPQIQADSIIPDDAFSFGSIPELPPSI